MSSNSFGSLFRITTFGESHGPGIGVVVDGCPAGLALNMDFIEQQLQRRRPGQSKLTTSRNEPDKPEVLSGVFKGLTTGAPVAFFVRNADQRPHDYSALEQIYRPGHADLTYDLKYGHRDPRGGGRSSARETLARVIGGAVAQLLLQRENISILGYVSQVGAIRMPSDFIDFSIDEIEANPVRCPHPETAEKMAEYILQLQQEGNSIGGIVSCIATGVQPGFGEPVYRKLQSTLAAAMLSINAVKGFDYGSGFDGLEKTGIELNDAIHPGEDVRRAAFASNHSGGILGGISTGQPLHFRVAFKPVSTVKLSQSTINRDGESVTLQASGRHDACVLPRAVPVVEAMCALVLADHLLLAKANTPLK